MWKRAYLITNKRNRSDGGKTEENHEASGNESCKEVF